MLQKFAWHLGDVFEHYKNNPEAMQAIQSPLLEDKVVDYILELASVVEKTVTLEELMADPEKPEKPAKKAKSSAKKKAPAKKKTTAKKKAATKKEDDK